MEKPIVSIVVPVYNPPIDRFSRCMESILRQSYREIEVILVDDGSRASMAKGIDLWKDYDSRVQVIHQKNQGVGNARNHGIVMSKGKYICFVDADDYFVDTWLSAAVREAEKNNVDIVYGIVKMVSDIPMDAPDNIGQTHCFVFEKKDLWCVQKMMLSQQKTPLPNIPYLDLGACGKLFRTEIVKMYLYPVRLPLAEDQVFNHKLLRQVDRVLIMDALAYYYICNPDSATHQYRPDAVNDLLCAMDNIHSLLFENSEVKNAFYFRLISEVILGIQLSYFHPDDHSLTMRQRRKHAKKILYLSQVQEAWKNIDLQYIVDKKKKIKIWLIKNKCFLVIKLFL